MKSFQLAKVVLSLFLLVIVTSAVAQAPTGRLRGQVTDPSGAVVPSANISLKDASGHTTTAKSDAAGTYDVRGLAPGHYTMTVSAKGFTASVQEMDVAAGQDRKLDVPLDIQVQSEQIVVQGEGSKVDTSSDNNAGAVILKDKDLDALSDDPDELQSELQALAGPAAGPNGGQIYIDGFTGGQLPPKASIREIRINQNPFSAEFDRMGFGRIEIFTKPGTDKYHGQISFNGNTSALDTRNPFITVPGGGLPSFHSEQYSGNFGGPMGKKASFFFNMERRDITDASVINAAQPNAALTGWVNFDDTVVTPRVRTNLSPRVDFQLGANNTLTARYQYTVNNQDNNGIGLTSLSSMGFNSTSTEHTVQISDTQLISPKVVNETRFEFQHSSNGQTALGTQPIVNVLDEFTSGGNAAGNTSTTQDHLELQNYTSVSLKGHFLRLGGRFRSTNESVLSVPNANGTFVFDQLRYLQTLQNLQNNLPPTTNGGGASQFSITLARQPQISDTFRDVGVYAEDDWRMRPNMTFSYGLRYETQNDISDHGDFAPRLQFAWGLDQKGNTAPKTVLRAGYGVFYDRFSQNLFFQTLRLNGLNQKQIVVHDPTFFPNIPDPTTLSAIAPTIYTIAPQLRAPYTMQEAVAIERQLGKVGRLSVNYVNSRGLHQFFAPDLNPIIGPNELRADPTRGDVYQYTSEGIFKQNQLITSVNLNLNSRVSLISYYTFSHANSDTGGAGTVPSNSLNPLVDYGRAAFDVRHRVVVFANVTLPHGFRLSPSVTASSGAPFNITLPIDVNGDGVFNDRPTFASDPNAPNVADTEFGAFNLAPVPGQLVPINFGTSPAQFAMSLRVAKTFGLGPTIERGGDQNQRNRGGDGGFGGGGGPRGGGAAGPRGGGGFGGRPGPGGGGGAATTNHKYNLTISAFARNLTNYVSTLPPSGLLGSQFFGVPRALGGGFGGSGASNMRIDIQTSLSF